MENAVVLQEILGVNKKNPHFSVCKHPNQPSKLEVYFGAVLLETVEDNRNHPSFKLLLARLYNSGVKVKTLTDSFAVPYTTLKRWGDALKYGDIESLVRVLAGRQHPRKLTPEILNFACKRFEMIFPQNKYSYSSQVREEIFEVFAVSISAETLRPHFAKLKQDYLVKTGELSELSPSFNASKSAHQTMDSNAEGGQEKTENNGLLGKPPSQEQAIEALVENNRKQAVVFTTEDKQTSDTQAPRSSPISMPDESYEFYHHVGILLFSAFLQPVEKALDQGSSLIKQWIAMVLSGSVNIEQSKLLSWKAFE